MDISLLSDYMNYRCSMYYWLKTLYIKEPTVNDLIEINEICKSYVTDSDTPGNEKNFIQYFSKLTIEDIVELKEEIDVEYARLFLGPRKVLAPPYESVYRTSTKRLFGENANEVRAIYKTMGLEINTLGVEPDDFIGFELEYMYYLSYHIVKMIEDGNIAAFQRLLKNQNTFIKEHLASWIGEFTSDIENNTTMEYFTVLSKFTNEFIIEDEKFLKEFS